MHAHGHEGARCRAGGNGSSSGAGRGAQQAWRAGAGAGQQPPRTEAAGELAADLELVEGLVVLQGLGISVDRPELDALQSGRGEGEGG